MIDNAMSGYSLHTAQCSFGAFVMSATCTSSSVGIHALAYGVLLLLQRSVRNAGSSTPPQATDICTSSTAQPCTRQQHSSSTEAYPACTAQSILLSNTTGKSLCTYHLHICLLQRAYNLQQCVSMHRLTSVSHRNTVDMH
jgi:hypothetical protein